MKWITKVIVDLIARKFYGKLIITFENGRVKRAVREETLMPDRLG